MLGPGKPKTRFNVERLACALEKQWRWKELEALQEQYMEDMSYWVGQPMHDDTSTQQRLPTWWDTTMTSVSRRPNKSGRAVIVRQEGVSQWD